MAKENKKPFVLRISVDTLKALESWAADDFRSVNGQIEYIINAALKKTGRLKKETQVKNNLPK